MAITINWGTGVISVPKADMTLISSSPFEERELDINTFRLSLKDLEDDEAGIAFIRTHSHNAPVNIGGVTLARVVEILSPYTVTFESGVYAVNLIGANSNILDKTNLNSVSIRPANSAGLIQVNSHIIAGGFMATQNTSGVWSWTMTADEIIKDALGMLNVIDPDGTPTTAQNTHAFRSLNLITKSLAGLVTGLWTEILGTVVVPADDVVLHNGLDYRCVRRHTSASGNEPGVGAQWQSYWVALLTSAAGAWISATSYESAGNFMIDQNITKVHAAAYQLNGVTTPLDILDLKSFLGRTDRLDLGTPEAMIFHRMHENQVYLTPIPTTAGGVLELLVQRELQDFVISTDNPDIIKEGMRALTDLLAFTLSPTYATSEVKQNKLEKMAINSLDALVAADVIRSNPLRPRDERTR